jgi:hypothetical protein
MAKTATDAKKIKTSARIVLIDAEITVNGIKHKVPPVNYSRVEHADGSIKEEGLPPGCPENAGLAGVIEHVLTEAFAETKATKGKKRKP